MITKIITDNDENGFSTVNLNFYFEIDELYGIKKLSFIYTTLTINYSITERNILINTNKVLPHFNNIFSENKAKQLLSLKIIKDALVIFVVAIFLLLVAAYVETNITHNLFRILGI